MLPHCQPIPHREQAPLHQSVPPSGQSQPCLRVFKCWPRPSCSVLLVSVLGASCRALPGAVSLGPHSSLPPGLVTHQRPWSFCQQQSLTWHRRGCCCAHAPGRMLLSLGWWGCSWGRPMVTQGRGRCLLQPLQCQRVFTSKNCMSRAEWGLLLSLVILRSAELAEPVSD